MASSTSQHCQICAKCMNVLRNHAPKRYCRHQFFFGFWIDQHQKKRKTSNPPINRNKVGFDACYIQIVFSNLTVSIIFAAKQMIPKKHSALSMTLGFLSQVTVTFFSEWVWLLHPLGGLPCDTISTHLPKEHLEPTHAQHFQGSCDDAHSQCNRTRGDCPQRCSLLSPALDAKCFDFNNNKWIWLS